MRRSGLARSAEQLFIDAEGFGAEADEVDLFDTAGFCVLTDGGDGDARGAIRGEAIDAGADGGKGDGAGGVLVRQLKAAAVAACKEFIFSM